MPFLRSYIFLRSNPRAILDTPNLELAHSIPGYRYLPPNASSILHKSHPGSRIPARYKPQSVAPGTRLSLASGARLTWTAMETRIRPGRNWIPYLPQVMPGLGNARLRNLAPGEIFSRPMIFVFSDRRLIFRDKQKMYPENVTTLKSH